MDFPRIDNAMDVCAKHLAATASRGTEIESYLARYLLTLIYASYEERIKAMVAERGSRSADKHVGAFVKSAVHQLCRSIKVSEIAGILGRFGDDYKNAFTQEIENTKAHNAYDDIISNRHDTAHSEGANVTFGDIERFYADSKLVLEAIEKVLELRKPAESNTHTTGTIGR